MGRPERVADLLRVALLCHLQQYLPLGLALHMGTAARVAVSCAGVLSAPPAAPRTRQHQLEKGFMVQLRAAVPATHPAAVSNGPDNEVKLLNPIIGDGGSCLCIASGASASVKTGLSTTLLSNMLRLLADVICCHGTVP